jgi:hypothetical protein
MLTLANPVVSILGAWWLFSEALGPVQIAGTLAVLAALGMIIRNQRGPRLFAAEAALSGDLLDAAPDAGPDARPGDAAGTPPTRGR